MVECGSFRLSEHQAVRPLRRMVNRATASGRLPACTRSEAKVCPGVLPGSRVLRRETLLDPQDKQARGPAETHLRIIAPSSPGPSKTTGPGCSGRVRSPRMLLAGRSPRMLLAGPVPDALTGILVYFQGRKASPKRSGGGPPGLPACPGVRPGPPKRSVVGSLCPSRAACLHLAAGTGGRAASG